ncbi:MAG: competence/damage-inducible protein A [Candidatus Omnitrophota bacterium]
MKAEIISIGTELTAGHIVDTNAAYLSRRLALLGIEVDRRITISDNAAELVTELRKSLLRSNIVFTIGGLGPTVDDITLYAIGSAVSRALVHDSKLERSIGQYFKKKGLKKTPKDALRQVNVPRGSLWFENKVGTAPAIAVEHGGSLLIALPGPPRELIPLFENSIIPHLRKLGLAGGEIIKTRTIKVTGLVEAEVNRIVKDLFSTPPGTTVGIYVHLTEVHLKIAQKAASEKEADRKISKLEGHMTKRLGKHVYGTDDDSLESVVGSVLSKKRKTLAIAESCTGGLIASRITDINGSSGYFKMGVVAYSNAAKTKLLGVTPAHIRARGAVSKNVALEMARGAKRISGADVAIAVTGIAGPSGGTKERPVGLVFIALIINKREIVNKYLFTGSRVEIKQRTASAALDLLRLNL